MASLWFRWGVLAGCLVEASYRVEYGALEAAFGSLTPRIGSWKVCWKVILL